MEGITPLRNLSRHNRRAAAIVASAGLVAAGLLVSSPTSANPGAPAAAPGAKADRDQGHVMKDDYKLSQKRTAQKQAALQRVLKGKKPFKGSGKNKTVPLEVEGKDRIFVILAEFDQKGRHPAYCDAEAVEGQPDPCTYPSDGTPQKYDGPAHNEIPAPDRAVDNSTLWKPDYTRAHYVDMYFNRMRAYYQTQSSGRYTFDGDVTEWVKVPFNQARYGRDFCGDIACNNTWFLLRDAMSIWVADQLKTKTMAEVQAYLKTFDIEDRYDIDGDGNYREPDNFIDHFQIVHAGGDQAAGDPAYGSDAIWSHRWRAALGSGPGGIPGFNAGSGGATGTTSVPDNPTGVWVGDYTIQPENGGLGVFAHEYGHDLGLPDLYDTSGNTGGAENNTAFWTLMSSGANIGDGGPDGIGDDPTDLGVWELFQLGWLNAQGKNGPFYDVATAGETSSHRLAANVPATRNGKQALFTVLPDNIVKFEVGAPYAGEWQFYSGQGNNLNNTMTKTGTSGTALTAKVNYAIEEDWDYAFLEASTDNGTTWTPVVTNLSDTSGDQSGFNASKTGITGRTPLVDGARSWVDLTATLPTGTNAMRFRYQTDSAAVESGLKVDDIAIGGTVIGTAETEGEGWVFDGFSRATNIAEKSVFNAYVAENRQYDGYDTSLKSAYNFSYPVTKPDFVESYPYQNGLLISYWNEEFEDNNVGEHPGGGLLLPVDAHPTLPHWSDNTLMRNRIASYDSTFGLEPTDAITLHREVDLNGDGLITGAELQTGTIASQPAVPTFDDTLTWWYATDEHSVNGVHPGRYQPGWYSVDVPKTGTTISVDPNGFRDGVMKVNVGTK
jgi:immune inhibitor A